MDPPVTICAEWMTVVACVLSGIAARELYEQKPLPCKRLQRTMAN
jgi:hypothetical protein